MNAQAHADIGSCLKTGAVTNCVYSRSGTNLDIPVVVAIPLTPSQLAFAGSQLNLAPAAHLRSVTRIAFENFDGDSTGAFDQSAMKTYAGELDIQAVGAGNDPIKNTLLPAVGAHLFYTLPPTQKQQVRNLYQAGLHRLLDIQVAGSLGSDYAAWCENSEAFLREDLTTLIDSKGAAAQTPFNLGTLLTAASFFASKGQIAFYQSPAGESAPTSGKSIAENLILSSDTLTLGDYTLLYAGNQITGLVEFTAGPTHGQTILFQSPFTLPDFAWNKIRGFPMLSMPSQPIHRRVSADQVAAPSLAAAGPSLFIGPSPDIYIPVLSPQGQKVLKQESRNERRSPGPHPVAPGK